mmetsp:Transcript_13814/g.27316  ORF Transcript_13814/g.27316 Transcript_13814/m.27316 type:complete len:507 (-) Transcript_13814:43-1563(-)|eukprot:CAMPEP_0173379444 /NCGR_PEP_ID=MMETSP1356-20130122/2384_1 /TAXON_ID=77927 ORGANISM="Hemiselmis virescens, Strain PCC157" /NCGR_SAMPLE_ID=MMETSP1356 /ASSEMBLY_ACC=CAM_ASM_000847 /LENGTH=506 /DNA_ID=CAMNT_0014332777 /DNA_START=38 /DNA_END=1558 /DNA_ORIENTATION=-
MPRRVIATDHHEPLIGSGDKKAAVKEYHDVSVGLTHDADLVGVGGAHQASSGDWDGVRMREGPNDDEEKPPITWFRIVAINAHAFNYGLFYASVGVILLPEEALRMFEGSHAVALAAMLVLGGVSQLISPVAGYSSDRCTHRWGKRMPYILSGNTVLFFCLSLMYLARTYNYGYAYMFLLFIAMLSLNVAYTGFAGLVSDLVPASQMGVTSGIMGGMTAAGAVVGLLGLGFLLPLQHAYGAYALSVLLTTPWTWTFAQEEVLMPDRARAYQWDEVWKSYYISVESHGDFFWVFCSRTGYYMAVSTQIYILYYLRDCMDDPAISTDAKTYTAILCILSQGCSGVVSLVAGHATARFGYKPLIYAACTCMAGVYVGYTLVHTFPLVVALGVCYGSSNGVYLAADYALAVACLPNKDDGAKDLALWGIAAFLGTMFGPCITGPTLAVLGAQEGTSAYAFKGYVGVMMLGVVYSFLAAVFLFKVKHGYAPHPERTHLDEDGDEGGGRVAV